MTNFELTSALATLDMFSTGDLIRSVLKEQISKHLVFPNKIDIKLDPNAENSIFEMPEMSGVVKINVITLEDIQDETRVVKVIENVAKINSIFEMVSYQNGDELLKVSVISHHDEDQTSELGR